MKKFILLTTLLSTIVLCCCSPTSIEKRGGIQLCGSELVETVLLVCGGDVYSPESILGRRSITEQDRDMYPGSFFGPRTSMTDKLTLYSKLGRRQAHGIVDECCYKPCSFSVLSSYCSNK